MAKISNKKYPDLHDAFVIKMRELLDIEEQLARALPIMAEGATDIELKNGFEKHAKQTEEKMRRMEKAFSVLDMEPDTARVKAIRGLIDDGEWYVKKIDVATVRDACILSAALQIEHYEIVCYETAMMWADLLGYDEISTMLEQTLREEEKTAEELTILASKSIYQEALGEDENTEDD